MEQNPRHIYHVEEEDTFTVCLTIRKGMKTDTEVKTDYITVSP